MSRCGDDYKQFLVQMVKSAGQEVINRAEDIVGEQMGICDLSIWLRFPQDSMPTLEITREHICKESIKVIRGDQDE